MKLEVIRCSLYKTV